jgi:ABC-type amino acid transport substrate-binding protein
MLSVMSGTPSRAALALCLAALAVPALASSARADGDAPVVVVVESEDGDLRASALRVAIARRGVPAYALSDDAAPTAEGTLTVAVPAAGPVRLRFTDPDGHSRTREVADRESAGVLARIAVRLVRESRRDREPGSREVLDPWRDAQPQHAPQDMYVLVEVLDPWSGERPQRVPPYSEVLDPWASMPSPDDDAPTVSSVVRSEVVDPWAAENGRRLDSPR